MFDDIHEFIGGPKFRELCNLPARPGREEMPESSVSNTPDSSPTPTHSTKLTHPSDSEAETSNPASACHKGGQGSYFPAERCGIHKSGRVHCNQCGAFFMIASLEVAVREMSKELKRLKEGK